MTDIDAAKRHLTAAAEALGMTVSDEPPAQADVMVRCPSCTGHHPVGPDGVMPDHGNGADLCPGSGWIFKGQR